MKTFFFVTLLFIGMLAPEAYTQIILPGEKFFDKVSLDSLQQVYKKLDNYDRRYFLEALPKVFFEHGIQNTPEWMTYAIIDALNSSDQLLVTQAIYVSGKFHIKESIPYLVELYRNARYKFGNIDEILRGAIANAIIDIDQYKAGQSLSDLLINPPKFKSDVFQALKVIGPISNSEIISAIDIFNKDLESEIKRSSIADVGKNNSLRIEEQNNEKECGNILSLTQQLRKDILAKEGKYE